MPPDFYCKRKITVKFTHGKKLQKSFSSGRSEAAKTILERAGLLAKNDHLIFISGESGTGKEALARQIHEWSGRTGDFTAVSCAMFVDTAKGFRLYPCRRPNCPRRILQPDKSLIEQNSAGTLYLKDIEMLSAADQSGLIAFLEKARKVSATK